MIFYNFVPKLYLHAKEGMTLFLWDRLVIKQVGIGVLYLEYTI